MASGGHRACIAGHNVLYTSAHDMLTQLRASRVDARAVGVRRRRARYRAAAGAEEVDAEAERYPTAGPLYR